MEIIIFDANIFTNACVNSFIYLLKFVKLFIIITNQRIYTEM